MILWSCFSKFSDDTYLGNTVSLLPDKIGISDDPDNFKLCLKA